VNGDAEIRRSRLRHTPGNDGEGRHRQRLRVDAERDLDHRLVAGHDDLVHLGRVDTALRAHFVGQLLEGLVRMPLEQLEGAVVHHDRRDPRDHVGAERLLRVQDRLHCLGLSGLEVEQRRHNRGGAEIECDRMAAAARVALLDVDQEIVGEHGGHLPVGPPQRAAELSHDVERHPRLDVVHGGEQALEIRCLIVERRLVELDIALLDRGPQDHVPPDADERSFGTRLERRHLDREVFVGVCATREPPAVLQLLDSERTRVDRADGRLARDDLDLALLARPVTAAGRVDRDPVPARGVEDRRAGEHARLLDGAVFAGLEEAEPDPLGMRLVGKVFERAHVVVAACLSRYMRIQVAPHSSRPSRKSVARTASTISGRRESMMALVSP
jgi:hypothetical protein